MEDILITVITLMRLFMPCLGRLSTPRRSTRVKINIIMTTTLPRHRHLLPHDSIDETTPAVHQRYRHRHLHLVYASGHYRDDPSRLRIEIPIPPLIADKNNINNVSSRPPLPNRLVQKHTPNAVHAEKERRKSQARHQIIKEIVSKIICWRLCVILCALITHISIDFL